MGRSGGGAAGGGAAGGGAKDEGNRGLGFVDTLGRGVGGKSDLGGLAAAVMFFV